MAARLEQKGDRPEPMPKMIASAFMKTRKFFLASISSREERDASSPPNSLCLRVIHSIGHVLELREGERLRPFETALGEHLKHRIDALRIVQAAERDEDHSWKTLQVGSEHPGAALRAEVSV